MGNKREQCLKDIKEIFREKPPPIYKSPLPRKMQRTTATGKSGKVKVYTLEERFLYMLKNYDPPFVLFQNGGDPS